MKLIWLVLIFSYAVNAMPVNSRLIKTSRTQLLQKVSFDETYIRYHGLYDIPMHLDGLVKIYYLPDNNCVRLTPENFTSLGGLPPAVEKPVQNEPGAFYIDLYLDCMRKGLRSAFDENDRMQTNFTYVLGDDALAFARRVLARSDQDSATDVANERAFMQKDIGDISPELLHDLTERLITHVIGPREVWSSFGLIGAESPLRPAPKDEEEFIAAVLKQANSSPKREVIDFIVDVMTYVRIATLRG